MLNGELFDKLNRIAQHFRDNDRPFGGLQVLIIFNLNHFKDTKLYIPNKIFDFFFSVDFNGRFFSTSSD
jgi:hypothetical protein